MVYKTDTSVMINSLTSTFLETPYVNNKVDFTRKSQKVHIL